MKNSGPRGGVRPGHRRRGLGAFFVVRSTVGSRYPALNYGRANKRAERPALHDRIAVEHDCDAVCPQCELLCLGAHDETPEHHWCDGGHDWTAEPSGKTERGS